MYLVSTVAAHDFGWIALPEWCERVEAHARHAREAAAAPRPLRQLDRHDDAAPARAALRVDRRQRQPRRLPDRARPCRARRRAPATGDPDARARPRRRRSRCCAGRSNAPIASGRRRASTSRNCTRRSQRIERLVGRIAAGDAVRLARRRLGLRRTSSTWRAWSPRKATIRRCATSRTAPATLHAGCHGQHARRSRQLAPWTIAAEADARRRQIRGARSEAERARLACASHAGRARRSRELPVHCAALRAALRESTGDARCRPRHLRRNAAARARQRRGGRPSGLQRIAREAHALVHRNGLPLPLRPGAQAVLDRLPGRQRAARPVVLRPPRFGGAARELHRDREARRAARALVPAGTHADRRRRQARSSYRGRGRCSNT